MDILFEILLSIVIEGGLEASRCSRIPKYIRYPLILLVTLFFAAVIGLVFATGFMAIRENAPEGAVILFLGVFMLAACAVTFKKDYLSKTHKKR